MKVFDCCLALFLSYNRFFAHMHRTYCTVQGPKPKHKMMIDRNLCTESDPDRCKLGLIRCLKHVVA